VALSDHRGPYRDVGLPSWFRPLTGDREYTKWLAGDLGVAFVVVAAVVAGVFWLKRGELPSRACG
jgi:hypothetical protein